MANFVTGWNFPAFKIYNDRGFHIETINLQMTDGDGLVETLTENAVRHTLWNLSMSNKTRGYSIEFTLSFANYSTKDTMLKIQNILQYQKGGYKIVLVPRSDIPLRNFEVLYTGDNLDMGIKRGGRSAIGNRLVVLKFKTKHLLDNFDWLDPDAIRYAGWHNHNYFAVAV